MNTVKSPWRIVAVREITTKLRDKAFLFSTFFTVAIIAISIGASAFLGGRTDSKTVAVSDGAAASIVQTTQQTLEHSESSVELTTLEVDGKQAALDAVESEEADAALTRDGSGWLLTYNSSADTSFTDAIGQTVSTYVATQNAAEQGIDLSSLYEGSEVRVQTLAGEDNSFAALMIGIVFALVFYMSVFLFGTAISMSVVEEKQNRIVEIIATAIPIGQLLTGKILGNTALAIGQIAIYAVVGMAGMNITGTAEQFGWVLSSAGWFVIFYIAGFVAIATVWAAVGAMASRSEDIGSLSSPITIVLVAALFGGLYAKGSILTVLSFIPVISSIAMPMRILTENVALWEPLLALTFTLIATIILTRIGARIYRNNIMRGGTAISWKQALSQ